MAPLLFLLPECPQSNLRGSFFALSNAISIPVLALLLPDVEDEE